MFDDRMAALETEFDAVEKELADPVTLSDPERLRDLSRRHKELGEIVRAWHELSAARGDVAAAREMLTDTSGDDRELCARRSTRPRRPWRPSRSACRRCCCRRIRTRVAT